MKHAWSMVLALMAFCVGSAAFAEPAWVTEPFLKANWTANPSNVLRLASSSTAGSQYYDGKMEAFGNNGNTSNGAVFTWTLPDPVTIMGVGIYTCYGDAGRDGINVAKIEYKYKDGEEGVWYDIGAPAVEYATKNVDGGNTGHKIPGTSTSVSGTMKAVYMADPGDYFATGVTDIRITFGSPQDNDKSGYGELEVIGYSDKGWQLKVDALDSNFGSISVSPTSETGYYPAGSQVTLTATPADGCSFVTWYGEVPSAQMKNATITLTMDGTRSVGCQMYSSEWIYANGKLSDGIRSFSASGASSAIQITGGTSLGGTNIVDLTRPIRGGGTLVSITGDSTMRNVKTLYLPDTITTLGNRVFVSSSIQRVVPFLPRSLTSLGGACFADAYSMSGSLRMGYATNAVGEIVKTTIQINDGTRSIAFQHPALGPVVDMGPGVTDILPYFANNCGNVTNLYLGGALTRLANDAFAGLGATKKVDITFAEDAPATFSSTAFGSTMTSQKMRFFLPWTGEETYPRWGAFITNETLVTPWKKLDPTVRQAYRTAFPSVQYGTKNPYGLTTASAPLDTLPLPADQWIMATIAAEAGEWVTGPYEAAAWQASTSNVLVTATADAGTPAALANGLLDAAGADGNVTNAQVCTWTLPGRVVLYGFNFYTRATDGHRDGIHVAKIEVQSYGSADWTELDVSEVEFGTANLDGGDVAHGGVVGAYKASYFRNNRSQLATDVVAIRVTFGNPQDYGATQYAEVEAIVMG